MPAGLGTKARDAVVDSYGSPNSLSARARGRRWSLLLERFPDLDEMSVVDLGGTAGFWSSAPVRPRRLILLNPTPEPTPEPWAESLVGDACNLPPEIRDGDVDLTFSNSVIEHVGGYARRREFADGVRALAPAYWIQTPNRWFPVEPHWVFPFFQFLPPPAKAVVARHWPLAPKDEENEKDWPLTFSLDIELIGRTEFGFLFPDADILRERFLGLTKSFIAVRGD